MEKQLNKYYLKTIYDGKEVYVNLELYEVRYWTMSSQAIKKTKDEWISILEKYPMINKKNLKLEEA